MHVVRPDIDNFVKGTMDAANGLIYGDDGTVCGLLAFKRYVQPKEKPGVILNVYWIT